MALSHGANDAQKAMGIITLALLSAGHIPSAEVPQWVIISCALAMGLGTVLGGWKIIRTLGMGIAKLEPVHGFAAETGAAVVLMATASHWTSRQYDPHHHLRSHGRGCGQSSFSRSLGGHSSNCVCLALYSPWGSSPGHWVISSVVCHPVIPTNIPGFLLFVIKIIMIRPTPQKRDSVHLPVLP